MERQKSEIFFKRSVNISYSKHAVYMPMGYFGLVLAFWLGFAGCGRGFLVDFGCLGVKFRCREDCGSQGGS